MARWRRAPVATPGICPWCRCEILKDKQASVFDVPSPYDCAERAPWKDGAGCTRPTGHDGDHVACGFIFHEVAKWPQRKRKSANGA